MEFPLNALLGPRDFVVSPSSPFLEPLAGKAGRHVDGTAGPAIGAKAAADAEGRPTGAWPIVPLW